MVDVDLIIFDLDETLVDSKSPKKRFWLSDFLPPLIFCGSTLLTTGFQKKKENYNIKRIKNLQKYGQKNLHPYFRKLYFACNQRYGKKLGKNAKWEPHLSRTD